MLFGRSFCKVRKHRGSIGQADLWPLPYLARTKHPLPMPFRFRAPSIGLGKGFSIGLGQRGLSLRTPLGTLGARGLSVRTGIPGLSWYSPYRNRQNGGPPNGQGGGQGGSGCFGCIGQVVVLLVVVGLLSVGLRACGILPHDPPKPAPATQSSLGTMPGDNMLDSPATHTAPPPGPHHRHRVGRRHRHRHLGQ